MFLPKMELDSTLKHRMRDHKAYLGQVIFVDVDDTLIDHHDIPKASVLEFLAWSRARGAVIYLWSQGGAEYCRDVATRLEIENWFAGFLPKPDIVVDDLEITSKFIQKYIHPIELSGLNWES